MVAVSGEFTDLDDEFALVALTAAEAGIPGHSGLPRVRRGWVNVPTGGHMSGMFWGEGPPELVFLHDAGRPVSSSRKLRHGSPRPSGWSSRSPGWPATPRA